MALLPNTKFLMNKQTKTPKMGPKNVEGVGWYCYSIPVFYKIKHKI